MVGSRPELPDNLKGSPRGWQKAQEAGAGGRRQSQQLQVPSHQRSKEESEEGWGQACPVQLCQVLPGLGLCTPGLCFSDRTPTELTLRGNV